VNGSSVVLVVGLLLCLAAVVILIIAIVLWARSRKPATPPPAAPTAPVDPFRDADADALRGDPRKLKPGDIVDIRGRSFVVRGSIQFTEGSWGWSEHLLDDSSGKPTGKMWLSVEEDPDLELVLWAEVPGATVVPGPPRVELEGRAYTSDESGTARYTAIGTTGLLPTGTVRYHDYAAPDGTGLSFEAYGDSDRWEVGRGEPLTRADVQIFPQAG
jgi:hypothetical protein